MIATNAFSLLTFCMLTSVFAPNIGIRRRLPPSANVRSNDLLGAYCSRNDPPYGGLSLLCSENPKFGFRTLCAGKRVGRYLRTRLLAHPLASPR